MNIVFLDSNYEELTIWHNYPCVPNVGDEVELKNWPKTSMNEWVDLNVDDSVTGVYMVKRRQWHEKNDTVLLIVERLAKN